MISSIQSNNVQRFSAVNALKSNANISHPSSNEPVEEEKASVVAPKGLLDRVDTAEIKKFAEYVGEFNISDDDIKYGLMYGRSVIAEFLA